MHSIDTAKRLSRRVAHDFNNILAVMQGYASILHTRLQHDQENQELAGLIEESGAEALKLTGLMSAFANKLPNDREVLSLNSVVEDFISRTRAAAPESVEIFTDLEDSIPSFLGNEARLEQACQHLWDNAIEAMPRGGRLCWQTSECRLSPRSEAGADGDSPPYIRMRVSDTGIGMSEETRSMMFEPYFTTKSGKDRGLGATEVYDTVRALDGFVEVSSAPDSGACIDLFLPALPGASEPSFEDPSGDALLPARKVLVVDDEDMVRRMTQALLKHLGYEAASAANGEEAIEIYRQQQAEIGIVVLDISLPGIGGPEIFRRLQEINSRVRVVISSGDPHQSSAHEMLDQGACGVLSKPFLPDQLSQIIEQTLG